MTPSEGKDSDSSDSRKTLIPVLTCSVDSFGFFPFFSSSVVADTFIGTMKSNYAFEFFLFFFPFAPPPVVFVNFIVTIKSN